MQKAPGLEGGDEGDGMGVGLEVGPMSSCIVPRRDRHPRHEAEQGQLLSEPHKLTGLPLRATGAGPGQRQAQAGGTAQARWGGTRAGAYGAGGGSGSRVKAEKTGAENYSPQEN